MHVFIYSVTPLDFLNVLTPPFDFTVLTEVYCRQHFYHFNIAQLFYHTPTPYAAISLLTSQGSAMGQCPMGRASASGGPEANLKRQGSASWPVNPCLTPPTCHTIFVPFCFRAPHRLPRNLAQVTYDIHSLSPLWPRNARTRDNLSPGPGNPAA